MPHHNLNSDHIILETDEYFELKHLTIAILVTEIRVNARTKTAVFIGPDRRDMSPRPQINQILVGLDESSEFALLDDIIVEPKYRTMVRERYHSLRLG
jgi:hypothetical protein